MTSCSSSRPVRRYLRRRLRSAPTGRRCGAPATTRRPRSRRTQTLVAAVGSARADALVEGYAPANLTESPTPPLTRADVDVQVSFLLLDAPPESAGAVLDTPADRRAAPRALRAARLRGRRARDRPARRAVARARRRGTRSDTTRCARDRRRTAGCRRRAALAVRLRPRRARRSRASGLRSTRRRRTGSTGCWSWGSARARTPRTPRPSSRRSSSTTATAVPAST